MIDIVYPLGTGSLYNNFELRFSLRSVEKHLKNIRDVYVIGECPRWLKNVIHIPFAEHGHASQNIMTKFYNTSLMNGLSDEFLAMNDDYFFIENIDAPTFPFYHRGLLQDVLEKNKFNWYLDYVEETIKELEAKGLPTYNFDLHVPIRYNKHRFVEVMQHYDFTKKLVVKSVYANTLKIEGVETTDCKVYGWKPKGQLDIQIKDRFMFSTGDDCLEDPPGRKSAVRELLELKFPNPSYYERTI